MNKSTNHATGHELQSIFTCLSFQNFPEIPLEQKKLLKSTIKTKSCNKNYLNEGYLGYSMCAIKEGRKPHNEEVYVVNYKKNTGLQKTLLNLLKKFTAIETAEDS